MTDEPLRLALVGAGDLGSKCLDALAEVAGLQVVGIADRNGKLAEQAAASAGAAFFTDQRHMLGQVQPDVLLVTTPPATAAELIRLAAQRSVHVIKAGPLARTLDEAAEMVNVMASAGRTLAVLAPRRFHGSYRGLVLGCRRLGRLFLARAQQVLNWGRPFGWRGDKASAGGGALLEAGYEMIDLIVWAMGLPEEVYAVTGRHGRPHMVEANGEVEPLGVYDTDDSAVIVLRYADGAAGAVVASWAVSPPTEDLILHGQSGSGQAGPTQAVFRDPAGNVLDRIDGDDRPGPALRRQLSELAEALASDKDPGDSGEEPSRYESAAREHLLTMAVVEAAYLSDRTGQSENPQRLLDSCGFTPNQCLSDRPTTIRP